MSWGVYVRQRLVAVERESFWSKVGVGMGRTTRKATAAALALILKRKERDKKGKTVHKREKRSGTRCLQLAWLKQKIFPANYT